MSEGIYKLIGLCMKAGRLLSGHEQILDAMRKGKGIFLIVAEDSSERTRKEYVELAERKNIFHILWGEKEKLGQAVGKEVRTALLIMDKGFSQAIQEKIHGNIR